MENKRNMFLPVVIARGAIVAAMMIAINTLLLPISFGAIQFRVAVGLVVFAMFGWEYVFAIVIGGAISNLIGGLGMLDYLVIPLCNLLFYSIAFITVRQIDSPWLKFSVFWFFNLVVWTNVAFILSIIFQLNFGFLILTVAGSCSVIYWTFGAVIYTVARKWLNAVL